MNAVQRSLYDGQINPRKDLSCYKINIIKALTTFFQIENTENKSQEDLKTEVTFQLQNNPTGQEIILGRGGHICNIEEERYNLNILLTHLLKEPVITIDNRDIGDFIRLGVLDETNSDDVLAAESNYLAGYRQLYGHQDLQEELQKDKLSYLPMWINIEDFQIMFKNYLEKTSIENAFLVSL